MKRKHVALPTLQAAATAFLATSCQAAPLYGVDETTSTLVASTNHDSERDVGDFSTFEGHPDQSLDAVLRRRDELEDQSRDLLLKLLLGGFGRRSCPARPYCSQSDSHGSSTGYGGGGYGGGVIVGGGSTSRSKGGSRGG